MQTLDSIIQDERVRNALANIADLSLQFGLLGWSMLVTVPDGIEDAANGVYNPLRVFSPKSLISSSLYAPILHEAYCVAAQSMVRYGELYKKHRLDALHPAASSAVTTLLLAAPTTLENAGKLAIAHSFFREVGYHAGHLIYSHKA